MADKLVLFCFLIETKAVDSNPARRGHELRAQVAPNLSLLEDRESCDYSTSLSYWYGNLTLLVPLVALLNIVDHPTVHPKCTQQQYHLLHVQSIDENKSYVEELDAAVLNEVQINIDSNKNYVSGWFESADGSFEELGQPHTTVSEDQAVEACSSTVV